MSRAVPACRATAAAILLAACGGADSGSESRAPTAPPAPPTDAPPPAIGWGLGTALRLTPVEMERAPRVTITTVDVGALATHYGVDPEGTQGDELAEMFDRDPRTGLPGDVAAFPARIYAAGLAAPGVFRDELGWDVDDVARVGEITSLPDTITLMDIGAAVDRAGAPGSIVPIGEGEDLVIDAVQSSAIRPTGSPLRLAVPVEGSVVTLAARTEVADAALALDGNGDGSWWTHDDLRAAAEVVDAGDPIATYLVAGEFGPASLPLEPTGTDAAEFEPLIVDRFTTVGIGWSVTPAPTVTVTWVFADEGAARNASASVASALGAVTGLADEFEVRSIDVEGRVVALTAAPLGDADPARFVQLLERRDPLFAHL